MSESVYIAIIVVIVVVVSYATYTHMADMKRLATGLKLQTTDVNLMINQVNALYNQLESGQKTNAETVQQLNQARSTLNTKLNELSALRVQTCEAVTGEVTGYDQQECIRKLRFDGTFQLLNESLDTTIQGLLTFYRTGQNDPTVGAFLVKFYNGFKASAGDIRGKLAEVADDIIDHISGSSFSMNDFISRCQQRSDYEFTNALQDLALGQDVIEYKCVYKTWVQPDYSIQQISPIKETTQSYFIQQPKYTEAPAGCVPTGKGYSHGGLLRQLGVELDGPQGDAVKTMVAEIIAIMVKAKNKACGARDKDEMIGYISAGFRDLLRAYDRNMNAMAIATYPLLINQATMY